jgi:hypothetical protein
MIGNPLTGTYHVFSMLTVRADAGNSQQLEQVFFKLVPVLFQVLIKRRHVLESNRQIEVLCK